MFYRLSVNVTKISDERYAKSAVGRKPITEDTTYNYRAVPKFMVRNLLYTFLLLSGLFGFSQENNETVGSFINSVSINTAGGGASSSSGSISYSMGIIQYTSIKSSNNSISQGIQRSVDVEIKDSDSQIAQVMAYPNPSTNYIILDIKDFNNEPTNYQIFSPNGGIMKVGTITAKTTKFITENWSNAMYFIKINVFNKFEETLKIMKY